MRVRARHISVIVALVGLCGGACRKTDKHSILDGLVREVVAPQISELVARSQALRLATRKLADDPTTAGVNEARIAWRLAAIEWRRAFAFRKGPIVETNALLRAAHWPVRPELMRAVLTDGRPLDRARLDELGIEAKGLFALEQLLFGKDGPPDPGAKPGGEPDVAAGILTGAAGERERAYARALGDDIAGYAEEIASRMGKQGGDFAARFAAAGQSSVNELVNQMVATIEGVKTSRLDVALGLAANGMLRPSEIEGWPSGSSCELTLALVTSTEHLYTGAGRSGLADLVSAAAPAIDGRVRAAFARAGKVIAELGAPLEKVVVARRSSVEGAAAATRELELALKIDLANALGVTLTFTGGDGD